MNKLWEIYIFDRFPVFGTGVKSVLEKEPDMFISQVFQKERELFRVLRNAQPHLLFIDAVHSPDGCLPLVRKVKQTCPKLKVLVITAQEISIIQINEMMIAGIEGMLRCDADCDKLRTAIHEVLSGNRFFPGQMMTHYSLSGETPELIRTDKISGLDSPPITPREVEVLKFYAKGLTAKEVGNQLFISQRTVETHKKNIMFKLQIRTTADLVKYAILHRII